jgi:hypothetical protein
MDGCENVGPVPVDNPPGWTSMLVVEVEMDIEEKPFVNGRMFELTLREHKEGDRTYWVAWVKVPGKEREKGSTESFTGISQGQVRQVAEKWMLKYKS